MFKQVITSVTPKSESHPTANRQQPGSSAQSTHTSDPLRAEVRNLQFWYGGKVQALKGVSLPIADKKITALIGPSGCGKSTLLRSINRMHDLYPGNRYDGEIILHPDGHNLITMAPELVRLTVGMVFQKPNPFPKSIYENVVAGLRIRGIRNKAELEERAEYSLRSAALWDEVKDRLHTSAYGLSGGQQQRLCIARALAPKPDLLLLDEPTSALDPIATAKIEDLLSDLHKEITVVIVTHNMQQAARISHYTAYMHMGEMVEFSETSKLFSAPENEKTRDYITGRFG
ncbi:phosphate ABC transporter ATP-binding protein PstB [Photobacterium halotolerans]|uniref:phosphate ABC transporter ATP-binding protein PstB n=1 Tax=Photobacterium halotolerans TaxID=265726 RepID=UPI000412E633